MYLKEGKGKTAGSVCNAGKTYIRAYTFSGKRFGEHQSKLVETDIILMIEGSLLLEDPLPVIAVLIVSITRFLWAWNKTVLNYSNHKESGYNYYLITLS